LKPLLRQPFRTREGSTVIGILAHSFNEQLYIVM